ncbi:hypothetical protein PL75_00555 [Neisseria arctica]|uniref:FAD-binding FR-type domain-containing protein n=1 Tax=Neisseria arctica TaxID=1470200 RepID=A0A0J0YUT5_9NEIS|nr:ferric reductase-like transmembrane domain-containing protein [Neisseria arctica]KLT73864.1 hypothetical protein PL75_00555 [Neisseria arctica]UOO86946.1 ferric reductase-like transmembrane domain-containing protein [Neisseria arctica]
MRSVKFNLVIFYGILTALWLLTGDLFSVKPEFRAWRELLMQLTGIWAMGAMAGCMYLAVRPVWPEKYFNGLDKMYRFHKWLGITALVGSVLHWMVKESPGWLVGLGLLQMGPRPRRPEGVENQILTLKDWLGSQRHLAETVGEWAFYAAVVLLVVALIKRIPYRWFVKFHQLLAVLFLGLAFHFLVLFKYENWSKPIGWLMICVVAAGVAGALWVLLGKTGKSRQYRGEIVSMDYDASCQTHTVGIELRQAWPGHEAGQFVFVKASDKEPPHPFTLSSAWRDDNRLQVMVKALGDYTNHIGRNWQRGTAMRIEGPYGKFDFQDGKRQLWVSAGIGRTPFLARLEQIEPYGQDVVWYHCVSDSSEQYIGEMVKAAEIKGIRLQIVDSKLRGRLNGEILRAEVADWRQRSVWFCGPTEFGKTLFADLRRNGLEKGDFHQELFEMR